MKLLVFGKLLPAEKKNHSCLPACTTTSKKNTLTDKARATYHLFARNVVDQDIELSKDQFYELTRILVAYTKSDDKTDPIYEPLVSAMNLKKLMQDGLSDYFESFNPSTLEKAVSLPAFFYCMLFLANLGVIPKDDDTFYTLTNTQYEYLDHFCKTQLTSQNRKDIISGMIMLINANSGYPLELLSNLAINPQFDFRLFATQPAKIPALQLIFAMHPDYPGKNIALMIGFKKLANVQLELTAILNEPGNQDVFEAIVVSKQPEVLAKAFMNFSKYGNKHELFRKVLASPAQEELAEILSNKPDQNEIVLKSKHPKALNHALDELTKFGIKNVSSNLIARLDNAQDPKAEARKLLDETRAKLSYWTVFAAQPKNPVIERDLRRDQTPSP